MCLWKVTLHSRPVASRSCTYASSVRINLPRSALVIACQIHDCWCETQGSTTTMRAPGLCNLSKSRYLRSVSQVWSSKWCRRAKSRNVTCPPDGIRTELASPTNQAPRAPNFFRADSTYLMFSSTPTYLIFFVILSIISLVPHPISIIISLLSILIIFNKCFLLLLARNKCCTLLYIKEKFSNVFFNR